MRRVREDIPSERSGEIKIPNYLILIQLFITRITDECAWLNLYCKLNPPSWQKAEINKLCSIYNPNSTKSIFLRTWRVGGKKKEHHVRRELPVESYRK